MLVCAARRLAPALVAISALGACGGPRAVGVDPSAPAATPDAGGGATCEVVGFELGEVVEVGESRLIGEPGATVLASGATVLYTDRTTLGANAPGDLEIFAVQVDAPGREQLSADDGDSVLVGAGVGPGSVPGVLWAELAPGARYDDPVRLRYRTADRDVPLGEFRGLYDALYFGGYAGAGYGALPRRQVDPARIAWQADGAIYSFDGETVSELARVSGDRAGPPFVAGEAIAWTSRDGDSEVFAYRDGRAAQLTDDVVEDLGPVVAAGQVIWLCGASICADDGSGRRVLDEGACQVPASDGAQAVWICDGQVKRYDGRQVQQVSAGKASRHAPRIAGALVAWVEDRTPQQSPYSARGTLVLAAGGAQRDVGELALPCVVCDRYDPPLDIALTSEAIAWRTPLRAGEARFAAEGHAYAYASVAPEQRCR
jgi:hypothetical protein